MSNKILQQISKFIRLHPDTKHIGVNKEDFEDLIKHPQFHLMRDWKYGDYFHYLGKIIYKI
jgi:hypothetical protein